MMRIKALALAASLCASVGMAREYHVSPSGSDANAGTRSSPWSLSKANAAGRPGDTILLGNGEYRTPIAPARPGEKGRPIVYRAAAGAKPILTNLSGKWTVAIQLRQRSWVTLEGIAVKDVSRFLEAENSSHLTVTRCRFENTDGYGGWENCSLKHMGDFFRFTHNTINNGTDSLSIQGGNHHLIEGNTFGKAKHVSLTLMGVQRSVVRNNKLSNPLHLAMFVGGTRPREWKGPLRKFMYNVIENNVFHVAEESALQYCGNRTILRRNIFWKCDSGIGWGGYGDGKGTDSDEGLYDHANRFYNNVIYDCGLRGRKESNAAGMTFAIGASIREFGDQVSVNNIIYRNYSGLRDKALETVQVSFFWDGVPSHGRFFYNDILCVRPGQPVFFWADANWEKKRHKENLSLREYETIYSRYAARNIEGDPMFRDPENGDFHLRPGSPCIDAGGPLTRTKSAGEGRAVEVEDALFFCDGHRVVEPDVIRVGKERVRIVKVDYETNAITVRKNISWEKGAPVGLDYEGEAPDIGAFEFGYGEASRDPARE